MLCQVRTIRSEDSLWELELFDRTQMARLDGRHPHPLNHLACPKPGFNILVKNSRIKMPQGTEF